MKRLCTIFMLMIAAFSSYIYAAGTTIDFNEPEQFIADDHYSAQGISHFVNGYIYGDRLELSTTNPNDKIIITFSNPHSIVKLDLVAIASNIPSTNLTAYDGDGGTGNEVYSQTLYANNGQFVLYGSSNIKSITISNAYSNSGASLWNDYDNLYFDPALPVELTSFTAELSAKEINLNWNTATEVNNYGFEVQKLSQNSSSSPGSVEAWEKIGFVKGNGTSNNVNKYSFVDKTASGTAPKYRLKQIDNDGKFEYSKVVEVNLEQPVDYSLSQNFPNPFNPSTEISYSIPKSNNVELKVYNSIGKEVATLVNGMQEAGNHKVQFNSSNLSSGIYFYRLTSGNFTQIKKMILLK